MALGHLIVIVDLVVAYRQQIRQIADHRKDLFELYELVPVHPVLDDIAGVEQERRRRVE